jgi:hypothetical protein
MWLFYPTLCNVAPCSNHAALSFGSIRRQLLSFLRYHWTISTELISSVSFVAACRHAVWHGGSGRKREIDWNVSSRFKAGSRPHHSSYTHVSSGTDGCWS